MDIKKCIGAATLPIVAMVILSLFDSLVDIFVPFLGTPVGIVVVIVDLAILGWAGYIAAQENGLIMDSAVTGLLAGTVSFFISIIFSLVLAVDVFPSDTLGIIFTILFFTIIGSVVGVIFGAAGGFVSSKMKGGTTKGPAKAVKK